MTAARGGNRLRWIAVAAVVAAAIGGYFVWRALAPREDTDDAQVTGHVSPVAARVGGTVIEITVTDNQLVIAGKAKVADDGAQQLYRGIAARSFERRFELAEFIKPVGAQLVNGLLHIDLVREVPEAMKPRAIKIESAQAKPSLEAKAA